MHESMKPGEIRSFDEGNRRALVLAVGIWAERRGKMIHIHLTGPKDFHTTVTGTVGSVRYHKTLFRDLRRVLLREGRWPFGTEGDDTETD